MAIFKLIEHANVSYFLQIKTHETITAISISDMKNIWQVKLSNEEIVVGFKADNPLIQSSDKWISEYITKVINNNNAEVKCNKLNEREIKITVLSKVSSLVTKINFILEKKSLETMYNEITLPLLMLINELKCREEKLKNIVKGKDIEIQEFKFEGATITRKNAITEPFDAEKFDNECHSYVQARAKESLSNPCSLIYPTLTPYFNEFSSVVSCANLQNENIINESIREPIKDNVPRTVEIICTNNIKNESDTELKRKISESLCRTKRQKKSYKI